MKKISLFLILLFVLPVTGFAKDLNIFVSILPQKYFAEQIVGNKANIDVMVLPGHSPASYNPKPSQMIKLSKSDIYFSIGVPFEKKWMPNIQKKYKSLDIIDCGDGIIKREIDSNFFDRKDEEDDDADHHEEEMHGHGHHHHDGECNHDHGHHHHHHGKGFKDPHIWLSTFNAKKIAKNMLDAIVDEDPANKDFYKNNYKNFVVKLKKLHKDLKEASKEVEHKMVFVFHPSWGYFMDIYGLKQIPVEYQGKEPGPKYLSKLIELAKKKGIKSILVQPQFPSSSIAVLEKTLKLKVYKADPLAENWDENLMEVVKIMAK